MPVIFDEPIFSSRDEAQKVLDAMNDLLLTRKYVTIGDFYDFSGVASKWIDHKYGWKALVGVAPFPHDGGFKLNLPLPENITK